MTDPSLSLRVFTGKLSLVIIKVCRKVPVTTVDRVLVFSGLAYSQAIPPYLCFPSSLLYHNLQFSSGPGPIFMTTAREDIFLAIFLEGFFYGRISVLSAYTPAKKVQLSHGIGLYSGIFALYLQCQSSKSRTAIIIFYAICLLYLISTLNFVGDLIFLILEVSGIAICKNNNFHQPYSHVSVQYRLTQWWSCVALRFSKT